MTRRQRRCGQCDWEWNSNSKYWANGRRLQRTLIFILFHSLSFSFFFRHFLPFAFVVCFAILQFDSIRWGMLGTGHVLLLSFNFILFFFFVCVVFCPLFQQSTFFQFNSFPFLDLFRFEFCSWILPTSMQKGLFGL